MLDCHLDAKKWVEVERPPTSRQAFEALDATYRRGVNNRNSIQPMSLLKKDWHFWAVWIFSHEFSSEILNTYYTLS